MRLSKAAVAAVFSIATFTGAAFAQGNSALARLHFVQLDDGLAAHPGAQALRARASILVLSETLAAHASYFDAGIPR